MIRWRCFGEISIHAPRVGCDVGELLPLCGLVISIHAPRVGCDEEGLKVVMACLNFNPRTPCGVRPIHDRRRLLHPADFNPRTPCGVRPPQLHQITDLDGFQSTHPVWGATWAFPLPRPGNGHFNPRTPCGVRRVPVDAYNHCMDISIHAPRVGCDHALIRRRHSPNISIHAPRVGCDVLMM